MLVNPARRRAAWRLHHDDRQGRCVVTEHAYHGVTAAVSDLSPEEWPHGYRGDDGLVPRCA
jgi:4-aminobutyrate aminotransferase-like enzyme